MGIRIRNWLDQVGQAFRTFASQRIALFGLLFIVVLVYTKKRLTTTETLLLVSFLWLAWSG